MHDPALLASTLLALDTAVSALMRAIAALEVTEWEQRKDAPELHEEAQGQGGTASLGLEVAAA